MYVYLQVNDLCNDLCEGDHTMSENATLMSHFQTSLQNRSAEVDEVCTLTRKPHAGPNATND